MFEWLFKIIIYLSQTHCFCYIVLLLNLFINFCQRMFISGGCQSILKIWTPWNIDYFCHLFWLPIWLPFCMLIPPAWHWLQPNSTPRGFPWNEITIASSCGQSQIQVPIIMTISFVLVLHGNQYHGLCIVLKRTQIYVECDHKALAPLYNNPLISVFYERYWTLVQ